MIPIGLIPFITKWCEQTLTIYSYWAIVIATAPVTSQTMWVVDPFLGGIARNINYALDFIPIVLLQHHKLNTVCNFLQKLVEYPFSFQHLFHFRKHIVLWARTLREALQGTLGLCLIYAWPSLTFSLFGLGLCMQFGLVIHPADNLS